MNIIYNIVKYFIVALAAIMALCIIYIMASNPQIALLFLFPSVVLYCLIPPKWGWGVVKKTILMIVISIFAFLLLFILGLFIQPLYCLLESTLGVFAVVLLLTRKPMWLRMVVLLIYVLYGICYVFNNDISGPSESFIRDMPFNYPEQWLYCYRFYWSGLIVEHVTYIASGASIFLIWLYIFIVNHKDFPRKFWDTWCS